MSYNVEKQYAKIIPASIIMHFLGAIREGGYLGFARYPFWCATLIDPVCSKYLRLPAGVEGAYVRYVIPGSGADGVLQVGDVITSLDGHDIDSNADYLHPEWGKLPLKDITGRYHYPGDTIKVEVFRDGRKELKEITLDRQDTSKYLVPPPIYDKQPKYIIVGGVIIQELTTDYLEAWGNDWKNKANKKFLYYYKYEDRNQSPDRKSIVVLNKVLPDDINVGYQTMADLVLSEVNGRHISKIEDVAEALKFPERGFHRLKFEEYGVEIILDKDKLPEADRRIAARYDISELQNIDKSKSSTVKSN
jgi:hypothetical protein